MNVVGVAGGIVLSERSSCARKLAPLPQKLLKKYSIIAPEPGLHFPRAYIQIESLSSNYIKCIAYITAQCIAVIEEEGQRAVGGQCPESLVEKVVDALLRTIAALPRCAAEAATSTPYPDSSPAVWC